MNGAFHAPPLLKGNQGGKALKWFPAHFNFEERNAPKSERERTSTLKDWPPCPPIQRNGGRRSRPGVNPFISALTVARCPAIFPGMWPHFGTLCPQVGALDEGRGRSYTPCLLMKPALRLRLHTTQSQPCFPAASNALALPGSNGIFTATPIERITHYTLLRKVVCQRGTLWKPQTTKQAEYLALSRCLILSLYLLSAASVSWSACSSL